MEDFLPIITLLIMVGGGLLKAFNGDKDEEEIPKKQSRPSNTTEASDPVEKHVASVTEDHVEMSGHADQLERLRKDMNIQSKKGQSQKNKKMSQQMRTRLNDQKRTTLRTTKKRKTKLSIKKNISKEGLAESVIMAEVLGTPRAKKPYSSNRLHR